MPEIVISGEEVTIYDDIDNTDEDIGLSKYFSGKLVQNAGSAKTDRRTTVATLDSTFFITSLKGKPEHSFHSHDTDHLRKHVSFDTVSQSFSQ